VVERSWACGAEPGQRHQPPAGRAPSGRVGEHPYPLRSPLDSQLAGRAVPHEQNAVHPAISGADGASAHALPGAMAAAPGGALAQRAAPHLAASGRCRGVFHRRDPRARLQARARCHARCQRPHRTAGCEFALNGCRRHGLFSKEFTTGP